MPVRHIDERRWGFHTLKSNNGREEASYSGALTPCPSPVPSHPPSPGAGRRMPREQHSAASPPPPPAREGGRARPRGAAEVGASSTRYVTPSVRPTSSGTTSR